LRGARRCCGPLRRLVSDVADADELVAVGSVIALIATTCRRYTAAVGAVGGFTFCAGLDLEEKLGADVDSRAVHQALAVASDRTASLGPVETPVLPSADVNRGRRRSLRGRSILLVRFLVLAALALAGCGGLICREGGTNGDNGHAGQQAM
jgi:hypothetical protein